MILFNNAKIYTVDGDGWDTRPATEMLVGDDGRILRVSGRAATSRPYNPSEGCCLDAAGGRGRPPLRVQDAPCAPGAQGASSGQDGVQVVDLGGRAVVPGFVDTHVHAPGSAFTEMFEIYLYDTRDLEGTLDLVRAFVLAHPERDKYLGTGFYMSILDGAAEPPRVWLDRVCADKPMVLQSSDGHSLWMNSAALAACGITAETKPPTGGKIGIFTGDGAPDGIVTDAFGLVPPSLEASYTKEETILAYEQYQRNMLAWGHTAAMHIAPDFGDPAAMRALAERGEWVLRVNLCALADPDKPIAETIEEARALEAQFDEVRARGGDPKDFRVTTVKFFADGVVEGKTAFLKEPYAGEPDTGARRGEPIWDTARLAEAFRAVTEAGLQIHVHAIGDAAVAQALDALEACTADGARAAASRPYVPSAGCCDGARAGQAPHLRAAASRPYNPSQGCRPYVPLRPVLTHLHVVDPGDFPRFAQLGVVASFQPFWHFKEPGWYDEIEAGHLGAARAENAYPVASLTAHGVRVTFSGDYPASPVNDPFFAIDAAVTRNLASGAPYDTPDIGDPDDPRWLRGAHERIPLAQAIEAYTIHGAYQLFREDDIGSLAPGKYADFLVLDRDPFALPPQDLDKVRVAETYRAGVLAAG